MVCLLLMRRRSAATPVGWSRQKLPRDRRLGPFYSVAVLCGRSSRVGNSRCYWLSCRTCRRRGENDYRGRVLHSRRKGRFGVVVVFPQTCNLYLSISLMVTVAIRLWSWSI